jgi:acyl-CoA synthetase (AMP-forming)/AMP-acid ligase II
MQVPHNLRSSIAACAAAFPKHRAIAFANGDTLDFHRLDLAIHDAVRYLSEYGVAAGDRVAILGRNHPSQLILFFACVELGAVTVPLNWRLSMPELERVVEDADPFVLLVSGSFQVQGTQLRKKFPNVNVSIAADEDILAVSFIKPAATNYAKNSSPPEDLMLCYTSGSSGAPKAVRLTQKNFSAAHEQALACSDWGWHEGSVSLCALPLFHIAGFRAALFPLLCAGTAVFIDDAQPHTILQAIVRYRVEKLSIVPSLLQSVIHEAEFDTASLRHLQTVFYGGAPMTSALLAELQSKIPCDLVQIYGLTESTGAALSLAPADHVDGSLKRKSCGQPLPGISLELRSPSGINLPGSEGEVYLKSETISPGYWRRDQENKLAFNSGWFRTGDLGFVDENGYLYLRGRLGDVIKSGGEKVVPAEVEEVLMQHEAIAETAVAGIPDPQWGELVAAAIVLKKGVQYDEESILQHCKHALAKYKIPKLMMVVESLPRNANGKLVRAQLKTMLVAQSSSTTSEAADV